MHHNTGKIIDLPKIYDIRGNLSVIESLKEFIHPIKRVYWIYDVPGGIVRGSHAFKEQVELIIALSGSFDVILNDGENQETFSLRRSYHALLVPRMRWRTIENFSTNSLCLIISSTHFDINDYIYNFQDFKELLSVSNEYINVNSYNTDETKNINNHFANKKLDTYKSTNIDLCKLYALPQIHNLSGNLTSLNSGIDIPFNIRRVYYLYDIP